MLYSVHIKQRCDGQMNCKDQSDEIECRTVLIPTDAYLKTLPPPPVNGKVFLEACFDLILPRSLSMKIQIMGRKITENLGFKSLLWKVKILYSFFLFLF